VKRFYKAASVGEGNLILLDGKPVRTPGRVPLALPNTGLAGAIAEEWEAQGETIDPRAMKLTGLANAAIDRRARLRSSPFRPRIGTRSWPGRGDAMASPSRS